MKILVNKKIKTLFYAILLCVVLFSAAALSFMKSGLENLALYIFLCALCMAAAISIFCYQYFREQQRLIENATAQITEYIAGDHGAHIECNDEGGLYRLFHEVNSMEFCRTKHKIFP
ncbi:hypothetical protein SAMN02745243_02850 [Hespellia stercorisuis DSM 15480]|uniref:Uncharacterized protein n=1 Tax=Hespellia stercorisuis DSM 15480 TaxID=1121950 RepID=A0A1M6S431_9FIRM|nr:hypothetical protein [Hespellia stercorisuis]SHK39594.1 hypothetical protein SAMN02745243_02850 [Hespellia stercorisuis DSM 15480]